MATIASDSSLPARLFGEGLPATGVDAQVTLHEDRIEVRSEQLNLSCSFADFDVREAGFGSTGFELAWNDAGTSYAVHVLQPDAVRRLQSHPRFAASNHVRKLMHTRRKRSFGRALALIVICTIVLLPLLVIVLFVWQAGRIAARVADNVSVEQEVSLGAAAFLSMRPSLKLIEEGSSVDAVRSLGERLTSGSKYTYQFHVADDESINAFALPGGIIVVNSGLISATRRPEELAGVLAHEIQHVEHRHSLRGAIQDLGLRGLWTVATGDVGATLAGQAAVELTSRKFSRDDEREADQGAFDLLVQQRIDPSAMADFFTTLDKRVDAQIPELLSTHPASAERKRALVELSQAAGTFDPLTVNTWPPAHPQPAY